MALVSKSQFAKLAGVSAAAITKVVQTGKVPLTPTGHIDTDGLPARAYLAQVAERRKSPESFPQYVASNPGGRPPNLPRGGDDEEIDTETRNRMSRREYELEKIKHQALALKLRNAQTIGTLVLREDVDRSIIGPINTVFVRLLTDTSKTIASQIRPMILGGATAEECEEFIRGQHSALLKSLKRQLKRALKGEQVGKHD